MKKIIILSFLLLVVTSLKAQTIVPLDNYESYTSEIPDGTYFKDVNHILDKFIGVWTGEYNGNTIMFSISKTIKNVNYGYKVIKFDRLVIHYTVTDASGAIIVDVTSFPADNIHVIHGNYLNDRGFYHLNYSGYDETKCARMGDMAIKTITGDMQMQVNLVVEEIEYGPHCTGLEDQIFPEDSYMVLDKQ